MQCSPDSEVTAWPPGRVLEWSRGERDKCLDAPLRRSRLHPRPPARLSHLVGPTIGEIELPRSIDWGPERAYDMGSEVDRRIVYERVLREAVRPKRYAVW